VHLNHKVDWNDFDANERAVTENTVLLVQLMYQMCKVKLVNTDGGSSGINTINTSGIDEAVRGSQEVIRNLAPVSLAD
jgi:hypothetical protein